MQSLLFIFSSLPFIYNSITSNLSPFLSSCHCCPSSDVPSLPPNNPPHPPPPSQVEPNPFPFNYVANYTVSTEVASMEFRTQNGTQIPISGLDDSQAITVAINNGSGSSEGGPEGAGTGGLPIAGTVNISHCDSVVVRVSTRNSNRQAGLFVQFNFTSLEGELILLILVQSFSATAYCSLHLPVVDCHFFFHFSVISF